jgi:hypothetical protein
MDRRRKRDSLEIKKLILKHLSDCEFHSYGDLERKVNSDWLTIRRHCRELNFFEIIDIENNKLKINEKGKYFLTKKIT